MVQSNGSRNSDVLTTHSGTDIPHDHAKDALRLALGSILAPKRYTPNPMPRSTSSSGTASPAHFPLPYGVGTPSPANSSSPVPQSQSPHPSSHLAFPHPHQHQHLPHVHSHLVPGREHAAHSLNQSTSSSTGHSPHSSLPATPITETGSNSMSSPSPFNYYPKPGLLSRSISSSSAHSTRPTPSAPSNGAAGAVPDVAVLPANQAQNGNTGNQLESERIHMHAPAPRISSSDGSPGLPPAPAVAVTTPGGTPIGKNKFIQTLEGKTHSAWEALIHGSFS
ncbi:hypothetical protein BT96DRAFT_920210 [Gymnopus androsaceus JB14]|uniref:Uncharacterized protein n=1 Tax=Gymnopus androsaceus JB14 TaxID=1447944 RepID=A0A6A4HR36_9AGAR|nr:hypothetical protein BT96DRAFT_920210 [Gymnopus androsaceus JB14]